MGTVTDLTPRIRKRRRIILNTESICTCGGLLSYIRGAWIHVDLCPECHDRPGVFCADKHRSCTDPEPVTCTHEADWSCGQPVVVGEHCAYARADLICCGCCWIPVYA